MFAVKQLEATPVFTVRLLNGTPEQAADLSFDFKSLLTPIKAASD